MIDVIVVGSGPGGVNAAAALLATGRTVRLLDYGNTDRRYAELIPRAGFGEIRRTDPAQHRYFLGDRFEGIPFGPVRVGAQLTPPRLHIVADAAERMALRTDGFAASPSLARGGLGAGWSAGVFPFDAGELDETGLSLDDLQPHYDAVTERIGVCGERDDLDGFFPWSPATMPGLDLDTNASVLFAAYARRREAFHRAGFFLGRTRLAVSTRRHRERGPEGYRDMAYWADLDRSIYRPQWTLAELEREPGFAYVDRRFVERFEERGDGVVVHTTHAESGAGETHTARALVLAGGTFGTAWIVLRSLGAYGTTVPLLCNPYAYVPTVNLGMLGRAPDERRSSLAQLTAMVRCPDDPRRTVQAQLFSYRSLLTFKLLKEVPLGHRPALRMLRHLIPTFAILGVHHEDRPAAGKHLTVERDGGTDRLVVAYQPDAAEAARVAADTRRVVRLVRRLGCVPVKTVHPGHGANIHYAGTFPIRPEGGPLTCDRDGRLRATRRVYLADGSIFPWISPKGLTFTIMANANRVGALLGQALA